jgi:chaperonin GroEL
MGEEAREKMLKGINLTADAVKPTLGPMARTVVLRERGKPIIVNDGVTVAKSIYHEDEFVNMGAQLLIEVATQAQNMAGDGTTTACVLAQSFCSKGMELINEGNNPVIISNILKQLGDQLSNNLLEMAAPIEDFSQIKNVATIAANNDDDIGNLIAEAVEKVGKDGVITVTESKDMTTHIEITQGLEIERGYRSPHFALDKEKNVTEMENPYILISNFNLIRFQEIIPILEKVADSKRPLLIISRTLEQHALSNLIVNVMGGTVQCCAIESPDYGYVSDSLLEDIAVITGGKFLDSQTNIKPEEVELEHLGEADKIIIGEVKTLIVNGAGTKESVAERVTMIQNHLEDAANDYVRDNMKKRIAKLIGGVAVLHVGAASEIEMRDTKERVDDALNATRAAMEMGVVNGGGIALLKAMEGISDNVFSDCLSAPYERILANAGMTIPIPYKEINAKTGEECNLIEEGIIDPVKVTISSLNSAVSVACLALTSEVLVGEKDEDLHSQGMF